jgi:hypothetical protein
MEKYAAMQMVNVHFPTTDDRDLISGAKVQPEKHQ